MILGQLIESSSHKTVTMPAMRGWRNQGLRWPRFRLQLPVSSPNAPPGDSFSLNPYWLGPSTLSHLCRVSLVPPMKPGILGVVLEKVQLMEGELRSI